MHVKIIAHSDQVFSGFWRTCRSRKFAGRTELQKKIKEKVVAGEQREKMIREISNKNYSVR